jgi:5'-3' exonuclease
MGVKGLSSFLNSKFYTCIKTNNIQEKIPSNSTIIVDGFSLLFFLYQKSNLDWLSGGEYFEFSNFVSNFLKYFEHYKLVIVFDGCLEESKQQMKLKRSMKSVQWIKSIFKTKLNQQVDEHDYYSNDRIFFLPILGLHTFLNVLRRQKNVVLEQSPFEADPYMAKKAFEMDAYVLTNDSDFMIYCTKGMILINELDFNVVEGKNEIWGLIVTQMDVAEQLRIPKAVFNKNFTDFSCFLSLHVYVEMITFMKIC